MNANQLTITGPFSHENLDIFLLRGADYRRNGRKKAQEAQKEEGTGVEKLKAMGRNARSRSPAAPASAGSRTPLPRRTLATAGGEDARFFSGSKLRRR
jgi:hypothetical protein